MIRVIHVGPKSYPPAHGGVETMVGQLVEALGPVETAAVFVEWNGCGDRVHVLAKGLIARWRQVAATARQYAPCIVHLHKETFLPLTFLLRFSGCRCVLTLHGCAWRLSRWSFMHRLAGFLLDCAGCWILHRVVFVGKRDWMLFQRLVPVRNLVHIPNGVPLIDSPPDERGHGYVYIGRLSPEKNILNLIDAAESAGIDLDLYGPFDRRDELFKKEVKAKIERCRHVKWLGALSHDQVYSTLCRYQTLINVSYSEGMPVSVLEGAACGLSLVLSSIPQHRNLEMPIVTYVEADNLVLPSSPNMSDGNANRQHVKELFGVEKMTKQYHKLYQELMQNERE